SAPPYSARNRVGARRRSFRGQDVHLMNDEQLLRYSRHILLPEIGVEGQEKFLASSALVVGAGGLGSPVALYLAAAGLGTITLADGDAVDLTNLQRQILHTNDSIGSPQGASGREALG